LQGAERLRADSLALDGLDTEAIGVLRALLNDPASARRATWQAKIVRLTSQTGDRGAVGREADALVDEIVRARASLAPADGQTVAGADLLYAESLADDLLTRLATTWHWEAQFRRGARVDGVEALYRNWLVLFSDRPEAAELRFFHGEVLTQLHRDEEAASEYTRAFIDAPRGKWAEVAAEESVHSWWEVVRRTTVKGDTAINGAARIAVPLPPSSKELVSACDRYVAAYPAGRLAIEAMYFAARAHFDSGDLVEATRRLQMVIAAGGADHPRVEEAGRLMMLISRVHLR
jgi:hypothetical protein